MSNSTPESNRIVASLQVFALVVFVLALLGAGIHLALDTTREDLRLSAQSLAQECSASGGVLIKGTTESPVEATRFSVCLPAEALTCVDVE